MPEGTKGLLSTWFPCNRFFLEKLIFPRLVKEFRSLYGTRMLGTAIFWSITQRVVVISYRLFGLTYRSHIDS
jgi:hypothetical protein